MEAGAVADDSDCCAVDDNGLLVEGRDPCEGGSCSVLDIRSSSDALSDPNSSTSCRGMCGLLLELVFLDAEAEVPVLSMPKPYEAGVPPPCEGVGDES